MATMVYAGFWRRFVAHFIDVIALNIATFMIMFPVGIIFGISAGIDKASHAPMRSAASDRAVVIEPLANRYELAQAAPQDEGLRIDTPAVPIGQSAQPQPMAAPVAPAAPAQPISPTMPQEYAPNNAADGSVSTTPAPQTQPPLTSGTSQEPEIPPVLIALIYLVGFVGSALYHALFIGSKWQATPGKRVMGCAVVSRDGSRITRWHALGRHLACLLSWFPFPPLCIGFFLAGWTREKTALHDMISATRVVRTAQPEVPVIATRG